MSIPWRIQGKIKLACTKLTSLDCRTFELVNDEGFLRMAQSILEAERYFTQSSQVNINELIPSPITVRR